MKTATAQLIESIFREAVIEYTKERFISDDEYTEMLAALSKSFQDYIVAELPTSDSRVIDLRMLIEHE